MPEACKEPGRPRVGAISSTEHGRTVRTLGPFTPKTKERPGRLMKHRRRLRVVSEVVTEAGTKCSSHKLICDKLENINGAILLLEVGSVTTDRKLVAIHVRTAKGRARSCRLLFSNVSGTVLHREEKALQRGVLSSLGRIGRISLRLKMVGASVKFNGRSGNVSDSSLQLRVVIRRLYHRLGGRKSNLFLFVSRFRIVSDSLVNAVVKLRRDVKRRSLPFCIVTTKLPGLPNILAGSHSCTRHLFRCGQVKQLPRSRAERYFRGAVDGVGIQFSSSTLGHLVRLSGKCPCFVRTCNSTTFSRSRSSPVPLSTIVGNRPVTRTSLSDNLCRSH